MFINKRKSDKEIIKELQFQIDLMKQKEIIYDRRIKDFETSNEHLIQEISQKEEEQKQIKQFIEQRNELENEFSEGFKQMSIKLNHRQIC